MTNRDKYMNFMQGWTDAAGLRDLSKRGKELRQCSWYQLGYDTGRMNRLDVAAIIAKHTDYVPEILNVEEK
jgi:hypothetical protein